MSEALLKGVSMKCRYCAKFKSVTLASGDYPKGKYKEERICPFKDVVVHRDDPIFETIKGEDKKLKRVYCEGFVLADTIYCEEGYVISIQGCLKRQESEDEQQCRRCKKKYEILEMRKIEFFMQRKREKAKVKRPKPIVR